MPNRLSDMVFDEVSLVYKGANQHSRVAIAKSAGGVEQEDSMGYTDQNGNPVDVDKLTEGDVVFDEDGQGYVYTEQEVEDEVEEVEPEPVLATVGKSAAKPATFPQRGPGSDYEADVRSQLSKALTDEARDEVIAKAAGYIGYLETQIAKAQSEVDLERTKRREAEYSEIAKSYAGLPVTDEELAKTLMDCADHLDNSSIEVLQKCLSAASDAALIEVGSTGGGFNSDVMSQIEAHANTGVAKSEDVSREAEIAKAFADDPTLYEQYLDETGGYNRPSYR